MSQFLQPMALSCNAVEQICAEPKELHKKMNTPSLCCKLRQDPGKQSINQSIKYWFIDKKDNPPDTKASVFQSFTICSKCHTQNMIAFLVPVKKSTPPGPPYVTTTELVVRMVERVVSLLYIICLTYRRTV